MSDETKQTPKIIEQLRRERELLDEILNHSADVIFAFDREGNVTVWSAPAERVTGVSKSDAWGRPLANIPPFFALTGGEASYQRILAGDSLRLPERRYFIPAFGVEAVLDVFLTPLRDASGGVEGGLGIIHDITRYKRAEEALTASEARLREANTVLAHEAMHDALTGLPNRRAMERRMEAEWRRTARHDRELSLLMIDIDHFKAYNDHYGHLQGDECLRRVAEALQRNLGRPADTVARYGGEEFLALLPETPLEGARQLAETMHQAVARLSIPHETSPVAPYVTISIGVSASRPRHSSPDTVRKRADQALYQAKEKGRNRVEVAKTK
ncbi:sensor domain-containing diguanylate cyclase [Thiohalomonas denitrificans]|uniref:diguanylate cyclase n=1 Tax=Thiohalomonas denitrificans TaxID=415747 RepID=A0A1G5PTH9_9GAMM|nr:sensor domain-containing diguanylate cyclase [Thiohalomonas denitrificans]SCZ52511.1 PAS domain S-box-containing protein/diguanylate cyclase (GGDEF) domain-containing protein [Thiohalomonas denitrificans]